MNKKNLLWLGIALLGAIALAIVALSRGETINAAWMVVAAVCTYLIAYRYYGLFIAQRLLRVDPSRPTPAVRHNDGLDYVPTNRYVLFGHHFAAIAGAGPLVGPVLAAQMVTCRERSGFWQEWYLQERFKILSCCSCLYVVTGDRWVTWSARRWDA